MGRRLHVGLLLTIGVVCVLGSIVLAELAFELWGDPCRCTPGRFGELCADRCITIAGVRFSEAWKVLVVVVVPAIGGSLGEWLIRRADRTA